MCVHIHTYIYIYKIRCMHILFSTPVGFVTKLLLLMVISDYFSIFFACEIIFSVGDQLVLLSHLDTVARTFKHML